MAGEERSELDEDGLDDDGWATLHDLRLRGVVAVAADATPEPSIVVLEELGYATRRGAKVVPTDAGRSAHAAWARLDDGGDAAEAAMRAYETFLPLNRELIRLCHEWQQTSGAADTWAAVDRLGTLDDRAGPVVRRVARAVPRFAGYRPALRDARRRVEAGERDWFASPRCDSYHTVWMRLHEDLLLAVGRARADEPDA